jgi:hypothetical protein
VVPGQTGANGIVARAGGAFGSDGYDLSAMHTMSNAVLLKASPIGEGLHRSWLQ